MEFEVAGEFSDTLYAVSGKCQGKHAEGQARFASRPQEEP